MITFIIHLFVFNNKSLNLKINLYQVWNEKKIRLLFSDPQLIIFFSCFSNKFSLQDQTAIIMIFPSLDSSIALKTFPLQSIIIDKFSFKCSYFVFVFINMTNIFKIPNHTNIFLSHLNVVVHNIYQVYVIFQINIRVETLHIIMKNKD